MRSWNIVLGAALAGALLSPSLAQQNPAEQPQGLGSRERFSGKLVLPGSALAAEGVRIEVRLWSIGERQRLGATAFRTLEASRTLTIYHLRGGELTTRIGDQEVERREGEFWTLRPGEQMTFETGDDSAVVETIAIDQG